MMQIRSLWRNVAVHRHISVHGSVNATFIMNEQGRGRSAATPSRPTLPYTT